MIDQNQIEAYALALLRLGDDKQFEAAQLVVGADPLTAIRFNTEIATIPGLKAAVDKKKDELLDEYGEEAFLPTKGETLRAIWRMAIDENTEPKDRVSAFKLFAEIREYLPKGVATGGTVNNTNTTNNVMIVRESASDDEWAAKAAAQQKRLMNEVTEAANKQPH